MYVHTEPPTAMSNLRVTRTTSTSITIRWTPVRTGRPDYYYVVEHSDPDDISKYIHQDEVKSNRYVLDNLRADTIYIIRVSVHNGVSDQDPENADDRMVTIRARTTEGRKYTVYIIGIVFSLSESLMYIYIYIYIELLQAHTDLLISCMFFYFLQQQLDYNYSHVI